MIIMLIKSQLYLWRKSLLNSLSSIANVAGEGGRRRRSLSLGTIIYLSLLLIFFRKIVPCLIVRMTLNLMRSLKQNKQTNKKTLLNEIK